MNKTNDIKLEMRVIGDKRPVEMIPVAEREAMQMFDRMVEMVMQAYHPSFCYMVDGFRRDFGEEAQRLRDELNNGHGHRQLLETHRIYGPLLRLLEMEPLAMYQELQKTSQE